MEIIMLNKEAPLRKTSITYFVSDMEPKSHHIYDMRTYRTMEEEGDCQERAARRGRTVWGDHERHTMTHIWKHCGETCSVLFCFVWPRQGFSVVLVALKFTL